ncbi:MAG: DNA-3-methyladenine glycosylase [Candidatus Poribacteria bacterium]|nr:DNA-3-methyladenine glycosylase [Candidatus Poribacteria bacterium]
MTHSAAPLPQAFYDRSAAEVAMDLLGAELSHESTAGVIVETEAYLMDDPACHAYNGVTPRSRVMFGEPGRAYVYLSYGCHWLLNAVADRQGVGSAALIRALEPTRGLDIMRARRPAARNDRDLASGPGRLSQALGLSKEHNGTPLWDGPLAIRPADKPAGAVVVSKRVGISKGASLPLRFYLADNPHVSKRARRAR